MSTLPPLSLLADALKHHIETHYGISLGDRAIKLDDPPSPEFGDCGMGCFFLSGIVKKPPAVIADELSRTHAALPYVTAMKAAGPYVNITLDTAALLETLSEQISEQEEAYGSSDIGAGKKILIEYSAPNTNKPQHLGHVRNNVLGSSLAAILEFTGYTVSRVNLINDRGIHICKSMLAYEKWGGGTTPREAGRKGDHLVGDFYVTFERKAQEEPTLINGAQEMLRQWEAGDKKVIALWEKMNGWVCEGFDETYKRMGCSFDKVYHESETYKAGRDIVLRGLHEGILKKNTSGDIVVELTDLGLDEKVLLRNDGTSVYITQDIGTTVEKFSDFDPDRAVWVVASEQDLHFKVLFHVLKLLGYDWADKCHHLSYGMVYLPEGRLKSREGKVVDADTLMDGLHDLAREEVISRSRDMDDEECERVAEAVALSALKFFILRVQPSRDIQFSPKGSLSFDGATGPFAQYSYARLSSILRRGEGKLDGSPDFSLLRNAEEKNLAVLLARFPETVADAAETYNPARIASWIFDTARAINKFHHDHLVLNENDPVLTVARGALIRIARQVLGNGLTLLGITPLERM